MAREHTDPDRLVEATEATRDSTIKSVSRALDLLEALGEEDSGLVDLGRRTGLTPSTTHRILATLKDRGYVRKSGESGYYQLGRGALQLGSERCADELRMRRVVRPFLRRIQAVSHETVHLSVLDGDDAILIAQLPGPDTPTPIVRGELRVATHATASGKAMLAQARANAETVRLDPRRPFEVFTEKTIVDERRLAAELEEIRGRGFAVDRDETRVGLACVAAPIVDKDGELIAAISVSAATDHVSPAMQIDLGELVENGAREASIALRGDAAD